MFPALTVKDEMDRARRDIELIREIVYGPMFFQAKAPYFKNLLFGELGSAIR